MSVGSAVSSETPKEPLEVGDYWEDEGGSIEELIEVPEAPPEVVNDPRAELVQSMVTAVFDFMRSKDPHRFWRLHTGTLHKYFKYDGWPKELQNEFTTKFTAFLNDGAFVTKIVEKVLTMENGKSMDVRWLSSIITNAAGFTAFCLCGLGD